MRSAFALRIISGKIILNFAFVALCGARQTHFHGRGRKGKRHLQRRFLRKRGAAGADGRGNYRTGKLCRHTKKLPLSGELARRKA